LQILVEEWEGEGHLTVGRAIDDAVGDKPVAEGPDARGRGAEGFGDGSGEVGAGTEGGQRPEVAPF
jgi:hypothetical protein